MKLMKERIVAIALAGMAVWGFMSDRARTGTAAATLLPATANVVTTQSATLSPPSNRDIFADVSQFKFSTASVFQKSSTRRIATKEVVASPQFASTHRLMAIAHGGRCDAAIVDRTVVAVGDSIDGYRLAAIDNQSARFVATDGSALQLSLYQTTSHAQTR